MVMSSEQHNGVSTARLTGIFGCLLFCSCNAPMESNGTTQGSSTIYPPKTIINPLDTDQAARTLRLLIDIWPSRVSKYDQSFFPYCNAIFFSVVVVVNSIIQFIYFYLPTF